MMCLIGRPCSMVWLSWPSLKITIRLPDAPRKSKALNSSRTLLDCTHDDRALIREAFPFGRFGDQPHAQQHVLIVGGERRHHVGLVAELHQRDEIAERALHAQPHEVFRCRHRREVGRTALLVEVGRVKRLVHARGRIDQHRDAPAGKGLVLAHQRRVADRPVPSARTPARRRTARTARGASPPRSMASLPAAMPPTQSRCAGAAAAGAVHATR